MVGDSLLYDDPTGDAIVEQFPKVAISEVRDLAITPGMVYFASMPPDQQRLVLDEIHSSEVKSDPVGIDVRQCAHIIDYILKLGDLQATSGNVLRQKIKKHMGDEIMDVSSLERDGYIWATVYTTGLRHTRRIVDGYLKCRVNNDKAQWAQVDDDLWDALSTTTKNNMCRAEYLYGNAGDRDAHQACDVEVIQEMTDALVEQLRRDQQHRSRKHFEVKLLDIMGNVTKRHSMLIQIQER